MSFRHTMMISACIGLLATGFGCDGGQDVDDEELDADEALVGEELGEAADAIVCVTTPPTANASGSVVGSNDSVTAAGVPAGVCERFTLHVNAAPPTDQARYATIHSLRTQWSGNPTYTCPAETWDFEFWRRDCTTAAGNMLCTTTWDLTSQTLNFPSRVVSCSGVMPGPYVCTCGNEDQFTIPGYSTKEQVRVSAKVTAGTSTPAVDITVSETP